MTELKIGVVTDLHSNRHGNRLVKALQEDRLDIVVSLGDLTSDLYAEKNQQQEEIRAVLKLFDFIGVPVFCIPGNYEDREAYGNAFAELEENLEHVIDATELGKYCLRKNGNEIDLIFVPGAHSFTRGFVVTDEVETGEYLLNGRHVHAFNPHDLRKLVERPDRTVVIAHNPCKIEGEHSIDYAINAEYQGRIIVGPAAHTLIADGKAKAIATHAGNELLTKIFRELGVTKCLSGDIHESPGIVDLDGNPISEGKPSEQLFANPGPAMEGHYGIVTVYDDGKASMQRFDVTEIAYTAELSGEFVID